MKDYRNGWGETSDLGIGSPDLSADLEWLLQSGQADRALVAEGLLHAYYAQVYRLCLVLENDPLRRDELLIHTFARAVQQAYRYRAKTDIPTWFFSFLFQELPKSTLQERRADLPVLLFALADLDPQQIADALNRDASRVKSRLDKLEKEPQTMLTKAGLPAEITNDVKTGPSWRQALQQRYTAPVLEDEQLEALAGKVVEQAEKRTTVRRRWVLLQELVLLGLVALGVAGLIMASDFIGYDFFAPNTVTPMPPTNTILATRPVRRETASVVQVDPHTTPRPTRYPTPSPVEPSVRLPPLTVDSSPISILERLSIGDQFWQTAWGEMATILYGPPGYLGPDRTFRSQIWLSEDQARIQNGLMAGPPDEVWIGNHGQLYAVKFDDNSATRLELVNTGPQKRPSVGALGLIFDPLKTLGGERINPRNWQIRIVELDQVAGRATLVVELLDATGARSARLWLDTQNSFVLRHQQFRNPGDTSPAIEVIFTRIAFDTAFPNQSLFDFENPYWGNFAFDPRGRPSRVTPVLPSTQVRSGDPQPPFTTPPTGFDPAQSQLSFLYPADFDLHSPAAMVEVFAETYHLGRATFANPWWMVCERSPDGRRIAAVSHPLLSARSSPSVYLLDLTVMGARTQRNLPIANVSELAFSPDSRQLALLGKGEYNDSLYLADLEADELRMLAILDKAHSLAWSPAGDQILLISELPRLPGEEDFVIFDAATGKEVRNATYDAASLPTDIPDQSEPFGPWYDNSSQNGGLEACAAPPAPDAAP